MTDITLLDEMTDPANDDLFHVIDVSSSDERQDRKITRQYLLGYTEYVALLTQSGTNAPVATVVKNDTGATVIYGYILTGIYSMTFSSAVLTANKTIAILQKNINGNTAFAVQVNSTTQLTVYTTTGAGTATNGLMTSTPVIVRIYV